MGYKSMMFLKDIKDGKPAPADPTYTGLDVCTAKNAATCVGGGYVSVPGARVRSPLRTATRRHSARCKPGRVIFEAAT